MGTTSEANPLSGTCVAQIARRQPRLGLALAGGAILALLLPAQRLVRPRRAQPARALAHQVVVRPRLARFAAGLAGERVLGDRARSAGDHLAQAVLARVARGVGGGRRGVVGVVPGPA